MRDWNVCLLLLIRNFEKEKRKQKRREKLERGEELGPSKKRLKLNTMKNSKCLIKVAVDCSFDDLMAEKVLFI